MRSTDESSTPVVPHTSPAEESQTAEPQVPGAPEPAPNAFDATFLSRMDEREEPPTAPEADLAGPWRIERLPEALGGGFGLFRAGEAVWRGSKPVATFKSLWTAQLVVALLPCLARDAAYRLRPEAEAEGFALESREAWGAVVGHVAFFDPALVDALHLADGLMRTPWSLALLLEACGKVALERAGAILDARLTPRP